MSDRPPLTDRERLLTLVEELTDDQLALWWRAGDAAEFHSLYGSGVRATIQVWTP